MANLILSASITKTIKMQTVGLGSAKSVATNARGYADRQNVKQNQIGRHIMTDSKNISETWIDIRCPACVPLGWETSRLLLKINGKIPPTEGVILQFKCHRCKSTVEWHLGTPILYASQMGVKNHKKQKVAFE